MNEQAAYLLQFDALFQQRYGDTKMFSGLQEINFLLVWRKRNEKDVSENNGSFMATKDCSDDPSLFEMSLIPTEIYSSGNTVSVQNNTTRGVQTNYRLQYEAGINAQKKGTESCEDSS